MKKKLTLQRETLKALDNPLAMQAFGGVYSGITTCVYCNVTKVEGGCTTAGTSTCPR